MNLKKNYLLIFFPLTKRTSTKKTPRYIEGIYVYKNTKYTHKKETNNITEKNTIKYKKMNSFVSFIKSSTGILLYRGAGGVTFP